MRKKTIPALALVLAAVLMVLAAAGAALAQTSPNYNLEWNVIGGGGQPATSAHYAVNSTVGQGAASLPYSTGAHYRVSGGYWFAGMTAGNRVYLPLVVRALP